MTIISTSDKLDGNQIQKCVIAGGYVILRAIYRQQNLAVMTATASEASLVTEIPPYPNQTALIAAAERVFNEDGGNLSNKEDRSGRIYIQAVFPNASSALSALAARIASALGLDNVRIIQDDVLADYWQDCAQDVLNEDEMVYLFDGVYVTKDGGLTEQ